MTTYLLSRQVFLQVLNGHAIVLDLRANKYLSVLDCPALGNHITGWPAKTAYSCAENQVDGESVIRELESRRILTTDSRIGKSAAPVEFLLAEEDCSDEWRNCDGALTASNVWRFLRALVQALFLRRCCSLAWSMHILQRRATEGRRVQDAEDEQTIRNLTGVFLRIRPLFYSAHERCFLDSIVLLNFLNGHNKFPSLVIGVSDRPFAAHCWGQCGRCALNELDTRTKRHRVIFVI